jgi:hypothetical protein
MTEEGAAGVRKSNVEHDHDKHKVATNAVQTGRRNYDIKALMVLRAIGAGDNH